MGRISPDFTQFLPPIVHPLLLISAMIGTNYLNNDSNIGKAILEVYMGNLDKAWSQILEENATLETAFTWILVRKFSQQEVHLSKEQVKKLQSIVQMQLKERETYPKDGKFRVHIEIEDEKEITLPEIEITMADFRWFKRSYKKVMDKTLLDLLDLHGDETLKSWKEQSSRVLAEDRQEATNFNEAVDKAWGKALDALEMLLSISLDLGIKFKSRKHTVTDKNDAYILDALIKLQARGCRVGREVLILLRHGLADGALARWRTLQEIAVFASFIDSNDNKVAYRYLLHGIVDEWREIEQSKVHYKKLGYKPVPKRVQKRVMTEMDNVLKEFGPSFKGYYGWAAEALGKSPSLEDLENATEQRYWQPYIQLAHSQIHALSVTLDRSLGMPPNDDMIMYGPSVYGISHPGRNTAYSLGLLTGIIVSRTQDLDDLGVTHGLMKLVQEVYRAFDEVDETSL